MPRTRSAGTTAADPVQEAPRATKRRRINDTSDDAAVDQTSSELENGHADPLKAAEPKQDSDLAEQVVVKKETDASEPALPAANLPEDTSTTAQSSAVDVKQADRSKNDIRRRSSRLQPQETAATPTSPIKVDKSDEVSTSSDVANSARASDRLRPRRPVPEKAEAKEKPARPRKAAATPASADEPPTSDGAPIKREGSPATKIPKRIKLSFGQRLAKPVITHPNHIPKIGAFASLADLLDSYVSLDDDVTAEAAAEVTARQREVRTWAKQNAALLETGGEKKDYTRPSEPAPPPTTHLDSLCGHAVHFARLMRDERRRNFANGRKIAAMVAHYWRRQAMEGERGEKEVQRALRLLAKRAATEVRRKWKLAEKEAHRRHLAHVDEQKRIAGKEQLKQILQHSTELLDARRQRLDESDESDAEDKGEDDEDHYLSVEELRAKYAELSAMSIRGASDDEDIEASDGVDEDEEEDEIMEDEDVDSAIEADGQINGTDAEVGDASDEEPEVEDTGSVAETPVEPRRGRSRDDTTAELALPEDQSDEELEHQSDNDSSPMDSELDERSDDESSTSVDQGPGLSWLYPELAKKRPAQPVDDALSTAEADEDEQQEKQEQEEVVATPLIPVSRRGRAASDAQSLPSASEEEDSDDEPMDSEDDEDEEDDDASEAESESPGLAWLYATPMPAKPKIEEIKDEAAEVDAADEVETPEIASISAAAQDRVKTDTQSPSEPPDVATSDSASDAVITPGAQGSIANGHMSQSKADKSAADPMADPASAYKAAQTDTVSLSQPFLLRGKLREYQHAGLEWLAGLHVNGTNGILADEMGLGKTIQTISLLTWLACEREEWGPHLIIVPTSVMLNWEMEFKKFAPGLKVLTYYGSPRERKEKRRGWTKQDIFHVCITSYQLVLHDQSIFRRKRWAYMILDEAHNIKNFKSQRWQTLLNFNTDRRLLLTGTPLQNNLNELWSLLYFLMPQGIEDAAFANLADFQEWFGRPVDKLVEGGTAQDDAARQTVTKLHRILRPYILRRLKADVEKQMPGKYEHIIPCRLSKRQRHLYDDFMSRAQTRETLASGNFLSIINCFMQLRKVCNHPDLFETRPIVTSLAFERSVAAGFDRKEWLIRRMLRRKPGVDLSVINLDFRATQDSSSITAERSRALIIALPVPKEPEIGHRPAETSLREWRARMLACEVRKEKSSAVRHANYLNTLRAQRRPVYSSELLKLCAVSRHLVPTEFDRRPDRILSNTAPIHGLVPTRADQAQAANAVVRKFACVTPRARALDVPQRATCLPEGFAQLAARIPDDGYVARTCTSIAFPDKRLLQFDCGKLQKLDALLRDLLPKGHRCLIFTQMTKMLDVLEVFLNIHGHHYFRLDGATKIDVRQALTERFNRDVRIPVFILSTRSGGLGINLTGADTVIFYDSDWNPSMDRQCQDRAHRIGQTRDVHIYRFVSEHTIEQNILKKARQKRILDDIVIGEGAFTTDWFQDDLRDLLDDTGGAADAAAGNVGAARKPATAAAASSDARDLERALAAAEDDEDARAAAVARREMAAEDVDVDEFEPAAERERPPIEATTAIDQSVDLGQEAEQGDADTDTVGHVDDYMIRFVERDVYGMDLSAYAT